MEDSDDIDVLTDSDNEQSKMTVPVSSTIVSALSRGRKVQNKRLKTKMIQVDGPADSSEEEDAADDEDEVDDDDDDDDDDIDLDGDEDDVSDEDASDLFETDNVVVCQYDKITRARNKWKFHLKDGIMNLNGKDYVFQKAHGDAEW